MQLTEGQVFGRYTILSRIGEGGMGAVYEVVHNVLKRKFAIKTLLPSLASDANASARFLREAEAASRIRHPNVVDVTDVGVEAGTPYLVMELLEGQALASYLEPRRHLGLAECLDLLLPAMAAVAAGHDQQVVHRDLKPQNIFLAKTAWGEIVPKVLDFGVSKLSGPAALGEAALTKTFSVIGTAPYMSPEQARGAREVDAKTDQFALGLVIYEALAGGPAYPGNNNLEILHKAAAGAFQPLRELRPDLPPVVLDAVRRMLEFEPANRFPSLREAGHVLLPFTSEKVQMTLREAFGGAHARPEPQAPAPAPAAGSTRLFSAEQPAPAPAPAPAPVGTHFLSGPAVKGANTTLRHSAGQIVSEGEEPLEPIAGGRRRGKAILAVAGLGAAAAVFAFVGLRGKTPDDLGHGGQPGTGEKTDDHARGSGTAGSLGTNGLTGLRHDDLGNPGTAGAPEDGTTPSLKEKHEPPPPQTIEAIELRVESDPEHAEVTLVDSAGHEAVAGRTPLILKLPPSRPSILHITKTGYEPVTKTVTPTHRGTEHVKMTKKRIAL
jgi:hypothetical protein